MAEKSYFLFWVEDNEIHHWSVMASNEMDLVDWLDETKEDDFLFTDLNMKKVLYGESCSIFLQTNGKDFIVWNGEPWDEEDLEDECLVFSWGRARYVDGETLEAYNLYRNKDRVIGFDREIDDNGEKVFEPVDITEYKTYFNPNNWVEELRNMQ